MYYNTNTTFIPGGNSDHVLRWIAKSVDAGEDNLAE